MNDRDRLAADLFSAGLYEADGTFTQAADRLIALGWTRLDVLAPVVTVEGPEEDGSYGVSIVAMPGHIGAAMTIAKAAVEAADAAEAWLEAYLDIDEERLARALYEVDGHGLMPQCREDAHYIAKAYREDTK